MSSERTGVAAATLRMGDPARVPTPSLRLKSGHRRYAPGDAELVRLVLREREAGLSLAAAIGRALASTAAGESSVFAGLRGDDPRSDRSGSR